MWFIAFNTESESENTINLLLASQVLMKSKAISIALASVVKIDESPGIRCILQWLSDITAQPTFEDLIQIFSRNVNQKVFQVVSYTKLEYLV